jgi:hypothetical protein
MLTSRIYRISRLTWIGFILVMLFVSYTFCVSEALASPVVSAEHETLDGSYIIRESSFQLNKDNPTIVDGIDLILDEAGEFTSLKVKLDFDGTWYECDIRHSNEQVSAHCDTKKGSKLLVASMDELQVAAVR